MKRETTLKILKTGFKTCQVLLPPLAKVWARRMFFTPFRLRRPQREMESWNSARKQMQAIEINVAARHFKSRYQIYRWGNEDGPTVLLIHGWSGRATQLGYLAEQLAAAGFHVICFDAPAHGDSDGKQTNVLEFLEVIKDIYEKYGPFKAMVGHSLGGVAAALAWSRGVKTQAIVTVGSPVTMDYLLHEFGKIIGAAPKTLAAVKRYTEKRIGEAMEKFSPTRLMQDSDLPGLIIHDEQDKESDHRQAPQLSEVWPGARLRITRGLGHQRILRDPEIARTIKEFLEIEVLQRMNY